MTSPRRTSEEYRSSRYDERDGRDRRDYYERDRRESRGRSRSRSPVGRDYRSSRDSYRPRSRSPIRSSSYTSSSRYSANNDRPRSRSPYRERPTENSYAPSSSSFGHSHAAYPPAPRSPPRTKPVEAAAYVPMSTAYAPSTSNASTYPIPSQPQSHAYQPSAYIPTNYAAPYSSSSSAGYPSRSYSAQPYSMPPARGYSFASAFTHLPRENWKSIELIPFEKKFYHEHASVAARTDADVHEFRQKHQMTMIGQGIPKPVHSFLEASFPDYLARALEKQGFTDPTAIQAQVSSALFFILFILILCVGMADGNVW